jgi:hypothetical protein
MIMHHDDPDESAAVTIRFGSRCATTAPCTVPKLDAGLVVRCSLAVLSSSPVLVNHSAEDAMMPDRGVEQGHGGGVVPWWVVVRLWCGGY